MTRKLAKMEPAASEGTISTPAEKKQVEERVAIGPHVVYETIRREGDEELHRTAGALAWSGLAAGLSMGFSFVAEALLTALLPDRPWRPLISGMGYSVGFLIVVLGRQQLFTENTLTVILPLLLQRELKVLMRVLRLWGVVISANLVGTFLFAWCLARMPIFDPQVRQSMIQIGVEHLGPGFGIVLMRAIFAGWLIALMVWLLPAAEHSRVSIIIILTYLIGVAGFNHVIAGSTKMFFLLIIGKISWAGYSTEFFLPTLIGNIIGGVTLVAALAHAQILGGLDSDK